MSKSMSPFLPNTSHKKHRNRDPALCQNFKRRHDKKKRYNGMTVSFSNPAILFLIRLLKNAGLVSAPGTMNVHAEGFQENHKH